MQKNIHQQVKDAISVLGVTLKVSNPLRKEIFIHCTLITCIKVNYMLLYIINPPLETNASLKPRLLLVFFLQGILVLLHST